MSADLAATSIVAHRCRRITLTEATLLAGRNGATASSDGHLTARLPTE
jgi:hypothetical protein